MDSISDNVMAIICVVVGILIIGCALVPIVDNASVVETEETTVTETSGFNTLKTGLASGNPDTWLEPVQEISIVSSGGSIAIDGEAYTGSAYIYCFEAIGNTSLLFLNSSTAEIVVRSSFDANQPRLSSGTVSLMDGTLSVTGTDTDSQPYSSTKSMVTMYVTDYDGMITADPTQVYGLVSSPWILGAGQSCVSQYGHTEVNAETETLPSGIALVSNSDGTSTVTYNGSGNWFAPYKWTGSITTTETTTAESEYKDLYAMIPVLCILGMAYVLIRRFY